MMHRTRNWNRACVALALAMSAAALGGCYERVVSSREYPGWHVAPRSAEPAPTATAYEQPQLPDTGPKFDPIGDLIFAPLGNAARGVGNLFSGPDEPSQPSRTQGGNNPPAAAGNNNSPPPANNDRPSGERLPFDTNP